MLEMNESGWWQAKKLDGTIGILPKNYVKRSDEVMKAEVIAGEYDVLKLVQGDTVYTSEWEENGTTLVTTKTCEVGRIPTPYLKQCETLKSAVEEATVQLTTESQRLMNNLLTSERNYLRSMDRQMGWAAEHLSRSDHDVIFPAVTELLVNASRTNISNLDACLSEDNVGIAIQKTLDFQISVQESTLSYARNCPHAIKLWSSKSKREKSLGNADGFPQIDNLLSTTKRVDHYLAYLSGLEKCIADKENAELLFSLHKEAVEILKEIQSSVRSELKAGYVETVVD